MTRRRSSRDFAGLSPRAARALLESGDRADAFILADALQQTVSPADVSEEAFTLGQALAHALKHDPSSFPEILAEGDKIDWFLHTHGAPVRAEKVAKLIGTSQSSPSRYGRYTFQVWPAFERRPPEGGLRLRRPIKTNFITASVVSGEVYLFASNATGDFSDMSELAGSYRGKKPSPFVAMRRAGYYVFT
jgi:hypothetical protein